MITCSISNYISITIAKINKLQKWKKCCRYIGLKMGEKLKQP